MAGTIPAATRHPENGNQTDCPNDPTIRLRRLRHSDHSFPNLRDNREGSPARSRRFSFVSKHGFCFGFRASGHLRFASTPVHWSPPLFIPQQMVGHPGRGLPAIWRALVFLVLVAGCGDLQFVPSPYTPQKVELIYSAQEHLTVVRWRVSASAPVAETRFEMLAPDGYHPIDFAQSAYPGGVIACGDKIGSARNTSSAANTRSPGMRGRCERYMTFTAFFPGRDCRSDQVSVRDAEDEVIFPHWERPRSGRAHR